MTAPYFPPQQRRKPANDPLADLDREYEEERRRAREVEQPATAGRPEVRASRSASPDPLDALDAEYEAEKAATLPSRPNAFAKAAPGRQFQTTPATLQRPAKPPTVVADASRVRDPRSRYAPGVVERTGKAAAGAVEHMVRNPGETLASLVTEPVRSAQNVLSPVQGERVSAARAQRGKAGALPGSLREGERVTKQNTPGSVTEKTFREGAVQTAANVALVPGATAATRALTPRIGALGAQTAAAAGSGVVAGAAYTPDDPLVGAIVGGLLAAPLPVALHGTVAGARAARPKVAQAFQTLSELQRSETPASARADVLARAVAQFDDADLRFAANDPQFGRIFRDALKARGVQMPPDTQALRGLLDDMGPDDGTPTEVMGAKPKPKPPAPAGPKILEVDKARIIRDARAKAELYGKTPDEMESFARESFTAQATDTPPGTIDRASETLTGVASRRKDTGEVVSQDGFDGGHSALPGVPYGWQERQGLFEDGFITSAGRFVNRAEGLEIARSRHQLRPAGTPNMRGGGVYEGFAPKRTELEAGDVVQPQADAPRVRPIEEAPTAKRKRTGETVVDADGVPRFATARTDAGRRRPVDRVSTDGLLDEHMELQRKFDDAQRRSQYQRVFDDDISEMVTVATRKGGGPTEQSKALRNVDDLRRAMDEVEAALAARGIDSSQIFERIEGRQEVVIERQAIGGDYDATNLRRNQITDDNGNVLFDPPPIVREFSESIRFAPRRPRSIGGEDVLMDPQTGSGERLVSQAIRIGEDLFDGGTDWAAYGRAVRQGYNARGLMDGADMQTGYLTDTGRFVTGPEAAQIALKANQYRRNTRIAKAVAEGTIPLSAWRWAPLRTELKGLAGPGATIDAPLPGSRRDRVVAGRIGEAYAPVETYSGDVPFNPAAGDLPTNWRRAVLSRNPQDRTQQVFNYVERFAKDGETYPESGIVEGYVVDEGNAERFISRAEAQDRYANAMDFGPEGRDWSSGDALFEPTGRDLFGNELPDDSPAQGSLLDDKAGTARSRNLRETEQAAHAELDRLRQVMEMSDDPADVQRASARMAELQKLVNRDKAITPDEMANRARAESPEPPARDPLDALDAEFDGEQQRQRDVVQGVLFAPTPLTAKAAAFAARVRGLVKSTTPAAVIDDLTNLRAISIGMSKAIGVPLHQGRGNLKKMGALGAFWIKPEVIRVRRLNMVGTVAHENGHFLSKKFGIRAIIKAEPDNALRTTAMKELVQMGKNLYGSRKPRGGYGEEGVAEAMKFYVTDPARLAREAPTYSRVLDRLLGENPDIHAAFDWARGEFQRFDAAPAESKLEAMIARKPARRFGLSPRDLVRWVWDDLEPVREAVAELGGADSPTQDAYTLARLAKGNAGRSREMLEKGVLDFASRKRVTRGLSAILEDLGERNFDAFERYWSAEQVLTKTAQGIDTGFDASAAQAVVDEGRKNPRYVAAAKELWEYRGGLLKYAADAGLMTPDELANIRNNNPTPTPFYRHFEAGEGSKGLKSVGRGLAQNDAGVRSLKGSDRQIVPPLESLVGDTYRLVDAAHKHHAAQTLIKTALETEGGGRVAELLPEVPQEARRIGMGRVQQQLIDAGWTPPDPASAPAVSLDELLAFYERQHVTGRDVQDMVMPVVLDGERKWVQVNDRTLWDALQGMTIQELGIYGRIATVPTRMLRAGATQLNPDFLLVNPLRDSFQGAIYSRGPTRPPGYHIARGLFHMVRSKLGAPDEIAARWAQEGGESAGIVGADRRMIAEAYQKTVADLTTHGVRRVGRAALHPIRTAYAFFASLENATRLGEFAEVRSQRMKQGMGEMDASTDAALAARDVTIDFLKSGQHTRPANRYIAFLTAQLNDMEKLAKEFNPVNAATPEGAKRMATVTARATAMITVPSVMLYLLQKDDPVYQELPEYWKASSWIIVDNEDGPIPYTTASGNKVRVWAFPRPHVLGYVFGYTPEKVLQWLNENDPKALEALAEQAWTAFVPPVIPTIAIPLLENYANKSTFNDAPVVPRSAENLPAGMQAQRKTGEIARTVGSAVDYSPAKIENVVRGWTGGTGMMALDAADAVAKQGKQAAGLPVLSPRQKPGEDPLESVPMLRRFVLPTPQGWGSESVRRLADKFDDAETKRQAWRELLRRGEREQAAAYMSEHKAAIRSVLTAAENGGTPGPLRSAMKAINDRQARSREIMEQVPDSAGAATMLDEAERSQTELARRALGRKP